MKYILSIDQSTSGTKAVLFDDHAKLVHRATIEHEQYYPKPGWVEHDPMEVYENAVKVTKLALGQSGISTNDVVCLSISNQRETVVVWDKKTGKPVCNAVVWQCMRGEEKCKELKAAGHEKMIREKTGLIIDPYFSASGLHWILNSSAETKEKAMRGELAAGTMDSWLIWKMTNGKTHATDFSNASRTLLMNLHTLQWDPEICGLFDIPLQILPEIKTADEIFGETTLENVFGHPIPISGILGDSHGALFGQRCFHKGLSKVTYGTGSSVMMNIGDKASTAPEGLVTSIGFAIKQKTCFAFEGNIHNTGATIKWMADQLKLISDPRESEEIAGSVESTEGVYFVPAFSGLGAPYWDNKARANISGIHGGTKKAHVVRAALESIAYQVKDLVDLMTARAGIELKEIRVDGGPTRNNLLMQFQSDMLNALIAVSDIEEASALGAALAGGLGTGVWKDLETLEALLGLKNTLGPKMSHDKRNELYTGWKNAVACTRRF